MLSVKVIDAFEKLKSIEISMCRNKVIKLLLFLVGFLILLSACTLHKKSVPEVREYISINEDWYFYKYKSDEAADNLIYDIRPDLNETGEYLIADAQPTEAVRVESESEVLKPWILPTANHFIKDSARHYLRPAGSPGSDFPFVQLNFNDNSWESVNLPHDWAIKHPFYEGDNPEVGGGMGRLPVDGVAWYRKKLDIPLSDEGKNIFLEVEGAMSYAMVWLNGHLVGGWPYGYNSWQLDLTPYVHFGKENQLAIRLDNPNYSSRWYPGGGIYRNVWLIKANPIHIDQWGAFITSKDITEDVATLDLQLEIKNSSDVDATIQVNTFIFEIDKNGNKIKNAVASFPELDMEIAANSSEVVKNSLELNNPKLWGPSPEFNPNLYSAVTILSQNGNRIDQYETQFGIRNIEFNPQKGVLINGKQIKLKGVNMHHDLGALGGAFNKRAAERQLEVLQEMGCNAIRMAHNPPAPELLELTDKMGFMVVNEVFDSWKRKKTSYDFHLIFSDWAEADVRSFIRRDRNHPSVIMWSYGNEVGEQYTASEGTALAMKLNNYIKEEDPTRPTTLSMNYAKPDMEFPKVADIIGLNYQGEGIRQEPEFEGTDRIRTAPQYDAFHEAFPDKMIFSSETASAFSSRGVYFFPVTEGVSSIVRDGRGGDSELAQVSSYELYAVDFGASADKVFMMQDQHPFVAGQFVWTGWDHLGEPTPYYSARSSYCGIIDLAGFKKDRFFLYQSYWRPDYPMVHILPHWNWEDRVGEITPVHVFTTGDEVELFLNEKSLGRKQKQHFEYRLRWDGVIYEPGELKAIAYKNGEKWAEEVVKTTGEAVSIKAAADRDEISSDGRDLAFVSLDIVDENGSTVPKSSNLLSFRIEGNAEIVAADNGDPTDLSSFKSASKKAFNGKCLVIIKSRKNQKGRSRLIIESPGLKKAEVMITSK